MRLAFITVVAATLLGACAGQPEELPSLPPVATPGAVQQDI